MVVLNSLLAFVVELMAIAAFARWGWSWFGTPLTSALGALACAGLLVALWAVFAAPQSGYRLGMPLLIVFKAVVFAGATAAIVDVGFMVPAAVFAGAAGVQLILAVWLGVV